MRDPILKKITPALLLIAFVAIVFTMPGCAARKSDAKSRIGLSASVDRKAILIGDRIRYAIRIDAPRGTEVEIPKFKDYRIGDFEIKDSGMKMEDRLFGWRRLRAWYLITIYDVGTQAIPEIDIKYKLKTQKKWLSKKAPAIDIKVVSVLPKGVAINDIKDIKAPLYYRNIYWGIAALAAALLIFLIVTVIVYTRLKRYVPVRLPHETALEELEAIRAAFLQGGEVKAYYVGVSDCIRRYIEHAFKLKAPEMTTEEFLDSLRDSEALTGSHKSLLRGFLNACDLVKFAKYAPTHGEAEAVYTTARNFVEETKEAVKDVRV